MKKYILLALFSLTLISCKNNSESETDSELEKLETEPVAKNYEKMQELQWLLGTWVNEFTPEFSQESWTKKNDSIYMGFSFTTVSNDTVFAERISLQQKEDYLFLTVSDALKSGAPIIFTLASSDNKQFVFENKKHDFPQRIVYSQPVKDSLHAWIEGPVDGENKKLHYYFSKVK